MPARHRPRQAERTGSGAAKPARRWCGCVKRPASSVLPNPVGWYDSTDVVVVNTTALQVLGFDGRPVKTIQVAPTGRDFEKPNWPDKLWRVEIRPSTNLTGEAAPYGF